LPEATGMKPFAIALLILLVLPGGPVWADEVQFRPAQHRTMYNEPLAADAKTGAIQFDDFLETDWERLARDHFTAYPLAGLSQAQIAELSRMSPFYDVAVSYPVPVTEDYRKARFVFLSADGMRRFSATGLRGIVLFGLAHDYKAVERVTHFGRILGIPEPNDAPGGGFVAMLGPGQELLSENIVGPENPALDAVNTLEGLGVSVQIEYRFSGDDSTYLFVRYEDDTRCDFGCCQFIYMLFREDPGTGQLTQVQSSMYACDV
jgi:hypothetical protein